MKSFNRWYSPRVGEDVSVARWGFYGQPVIIFPTAGGDAEEIERHDLVDALLPLIREGRIKVYSCDSIAGRALLRGNGTSEHRAWVQNGFQEFIYHELVPAVRADCNDPNIEIIVTGPSIGAFTAVAVTCRYPDAFKLAIGLSGTYDMMRFLGSDSMTHDFYVSSPLHWVENAEPEHLEALKKRFIILGSGEGAYENIGESWRMGHVLGTKGIPNRVDPWGQEFPHEWWVWRYQLPRYLQELA